MDEDLEQTIAPWSAVALDATRMRIVPASVSPFDAGDDIEGETIIVDRDVEHDGPTIDAQAFRALLQRNVAIDPASLRLPGMTFVRTLAEGLEAVIALFGTSDGVRTVSGPTSGAGTRYATGPQVVVRIEKSTQEPAWVQLVDLYRQAGRLSDSLVELYEYGRTPSGHRYMVTEYCPRGSLKDAGTVTAAATLRTGIALAMALDRLHAAGFAHSDVKPANILLRDDGTAVLGDLGMARPFGALVPGFSIPWTAPEMIEADAVVSAGADVYALAATLYTKLEGHAPYVVPDGANSFFDVVGRARAGGEILFRSAVPKLLAAALTAALSPRPESRPASALAFAEQLRKIAAADDPSAAADEAAREDAVSPARQVAAAEAALSEGRYADAVAAALLVTTAPGIPPAAEDVVRAAEIGAAAAERLGDWSRAVYFRSLLADGTGTADHLRLLGVARVRFGDRDEGCAAIERASALARSNGDDSAAARAQVELARIDAEEQRHRDVLQRLGDAAVTAALDDMTERARARKMLGVSLRRVGRFDESVAALEDAARLARGDDAGLGRALHELALSLQRVGRRTEALSRLREAAGAFRSAGDPASAARCLLDCAEDDASRGRVREAIRTHLQVRAMLAGTGHDERIAECDRRLGELFLLTGDDEAARRRLTAARDVYEGIGAERGVADCDAALGVLAADSGDPTEAEAHLTSAFGVYLRLGLDLEAARTELQRAASWARLARYREGSAARRVRRQAADIAIPAALYADAVRHAFTDSRERAAWATNAISGIRAEAFRLAVETGDDRLLADLIVDARATGTFLLSRPRGALEEATIDESAGAEPSQKLALAAAGRWKDLQLVEGMQLGLAPAVIVPRGELALAAGLAALHSRFGVAARSDAAVEL